MDVAFWRRWHRWIGFPAALFLLFAATTGFLVAVTEFWGEEEALREATRDLVSLTASGLIIYLLMRGNRDLKGIERVFW